MRGRLMLGVAVGLVLLAWGGVWGQPARGPRISARALTHQEILDYRLPEGTQVSAGLFTVGVGSPAYLEALVGSGDVVSAVRWSLTGPSGSTARLAASPLDSSPVAVPIQGPGDRADFDIAARQLLVPDKVGQYTVTASLDTNGVAVTLTATVTAANYVGAGGIAGVSPTFPQCALCHADVAAGWAGTRHAAALPDYLDGIKSAHFGEDCLACHTTGYDKAAAAVNGGFDDAARTKGWTFPTELKAGNWVGLPTELKALSSVQCESCHGPGSEHKGAGKISVSYNAGDCGQCHAEQPYVLQHLEWSESRHAVATRSPTGEGRSSCVVCHSAPGYVERIKKGLDITQSDYATQVTDLNWEAITCQACHDPHDATNPHQVRSVDAVTLMNGEVVAEGGAGKLCMDCHKARRNGPEYAPVYHARHEPHYGPQADMLAGTNAADYGPIASSTHLYAVEDGCATCHMQGVASALADGSDNPAYGHAGGHTFKPTYDPGTPDDGSDDVDLTGACATCHGPMDSFDLPRQDYDGDGVVEGVQTEVEGLLHEVATVLPPDGEAVTVTQDYTPSQLKAAYTYYFVEEDGSKGIHNTKYAVGLLKAALKDLTGRDVVTAVATETLAGRPQAYALAQNHPNPFNPETGIRYAVPEPASVRIEIYNSLGQRVRTLVDAHHAAGEYAVKWDGRDADGAKVTAGVYIYTMRAGAFVENRKMVLLP